MIDEVWRRTLTVVASTSDQAALFPADWGLEEPQSSGSVTSHSDSAAREHSAHGVVVSADQVSSGRVSAGRVSAGRVSEGGASSSQVFKGGVSSSRVSEGRVVVYTDGACIKNPGPGGWAWVVPGGQSDCGAEPSTTNQRMELTAVLEALRAISGPMEVVSDSTYVVNCFNQKWYENWQRKNWRNAKRKPVANRDLWEPLIELWQARSDEISWKWVKGHSGNEWNEIADQMAWEAAMNQRTRNGHPASRKGYRGYRRDY